MTVRVPGLYAWEIIPVAIIVYLISWFVHRFVEGPCRNKLYLFLAHSWKIQTSSSSPSASEVKQKQTEMGTKMITKTGAVVDLNAPLVVVPTGRDW